MVTTLSSMFPPSTMIGFDHLFEEINRLSNSRNDGFPKHNVIKTGDYSYTIQLAVAGCSEEDIKIEQKENSLIITGNKRDDSAYEYLHKGITTKDFGRTFRLAEHTFVDSAELENGILSVHLEVRIPEEKKPRVIPVGKTTEKQLLNG